MKNFSGCIAVASAALVTPSAFAATVCEAEDVFGPVMTHEKTMLASRK